MSLKDRIERDLARLRQDADLRERRISNYQEVVARKRIRLNSLREKIRVLENSQQMPNNTKEIDFEKMKDEISKNEKLEVPEITELTPAIKSGGLTENQSISFEKAQECDDADLFQ